MDSSEASSLHKKVEDQPESNIFVKSGSLTEDDYIRIIHDLEAHQVQLEMQIGKLSLQEENAVRVSERFKVLRDLSSEILDLHDLDGIYSYVAATLQKYLPDTIILVHSVDEETKTVRLEKIAGIENKFLNMVFQVSGFNPTGKKFKLIDTHNSYLRSGDFIEFQGNLAEFAASDVSPVIARTIEKLIGLHKIYTIGIKKEEHLLAAIHFFTFNNRVIYDRSFIEAFVKQAGIVIQKKMAENALKESEEKYRNIFENVQDVYYESAIDGTILDVSPSIKAFSKELYTREELVGKSMYDLYANDGERESLLSALRENGEILDYEIFLKNKDGLVIPCLVSSKLVFDTFGRPEKIVGSVHNITKRKNTEESLRESEERYRSLFTEMQEGFALHEIICDESGRPCDYRFLEVNPAFEKMTGLLADDIRCKRVLDVLPSTESYWIDTYGSVAITGQFTEVENYSQALGKYFHVAVFSPKPNQFATFFSDITERKLAEQALNQSLQNLKRSQQISHTGNWSWDIVSDIFSASEEGLNLFGFPLDFHPTLQQVNDQILPEYKMLVHETLINALQTGESYSVEIRIRKKDTGEIRDILSVGEIEKDAKGNPVKIFGINRDITDRKKVELELILAKEKAEENDRLKSAFLANMSHEIRTPLNAIIGFAELVVDPYFEEEQHAEFAQMISESGNNLLSIISDIMDLSKIEAGQIDIQKRKVEVNQLMASLKKEFSHKASQKGIELRLSPSNPKDEILIESDETKIRQVLVNFIGNSIKFTENGFIELGISRTDTHVQFHVKDTGIGIPEAYHDKIFERFRQVETAHTRKYGGNGLGLAISKSLVELLGGTIGMESEVGKGSSFNFSIPLK